MLEVSPADLDKDAYSLNCPDGTYDLHNGLAGRRDHDPGDLITKITAFAPGDEGKQLWLDCVNMIFRTVFRDAGSAGSPCSRRRV